MQSSFFDDDKFANEGVAPPTMAASSNQLWLGAAMHQNLKQGYVSNVKRARRLTPGHE